MTQNGGEGAGGQDAGARRRERLHRFLCELVKREGRMEAAVLLGVNYRTLVKAEESGEMTGRMSDALERLLLTWDGGVGDGDAEEDGEPEPGGDLARRVEALEAGLEELARELRSGLDALRAAVGVAANGDPSMVPGKQAPVQAGDGNKGAPVQSPPTAPPVAGLGASRAVRRRRVDPGAGDPGTPPRTTPRCTATPGPWWPSAGSSRPGIPSGAGACPGLLTTSGC